MQQLTAPELEILKLLWQNQPLNAKQLHQPLTELYGWGYSSTRKTLERMASKGYLAVSTEGNKNYYTSLLEKVPTLAAFAADFAKRVMEIDTPLPVAMFSNSQLLSAKELAELEQVVNQTPSNNTLED